MNETCGAKNRQGMPCRRAPSPGRNRCNLHGGKSLRGKEHPRHIHGYYTATSKKMRQLMGQLIRDMKETTR